MTIYIVQFVIFLIQMSKKFTENIYGNLLRIEYTLVVSQFDPFKLFF